MALNIFDAEDAPRPRDKSRFAADIVGRLKGGFMIGTRPVASETWLFTTDDEDVSTELIGLYGGEVEVLDVERGDDHRLITEVSEIKVTLDSPGDLVTRMVQFGPKGPIHTCDGQVFLDGDDKGEPCGCPSSYQDRKALSKSGRGPSPEIRFRLKLVDNPELGYFVYRTSSWTLVADLPQIEKELAAVGSELINLTLRLERVEYTTKAGRDVSYVRPVVEVG